MGDKENMETIRAKIIPRRELYRDEVTGFKIYSADVKECDVDIEKNNYDNISLKGDNLPDFNMDSVYDVELAKNGRDKYKGSYVMVKNYFVKPQTPSEQWKFLSMVVTETQYASIASRYKDGLDSIIDIIMDGEFEYESVRGYGEPTYQILKDKIRNDLDVSEALAYFSEYEIPYNTIKRLVVLYGSSEVAIQKIEENPYAIIEKNGFGFLKADDLAMKMGIPADSEHRIKSCMIYILDEINDSGDIWIEKKKLYNKMKKLLGVPKKPIQDIMESEHKEVFVYGDRYAGADSAYQEIFLSAMIADKVRNEESKLKEVGYDPEEFIKKFEELNDITLSDKQREFLNKLDKTNILFLIGNAGTGKSMIQKIIIEVAESLNLSYALLAPTGKASRVLKNYTGREAYTIHKKLGIGGFEEVVELSEDIILVDEASMCDINIASKLVSSIKENSLVVFIGDDAQIPSVGEGNFLFDCINFEEIPKVKLDKVFRQKESGMLNAITMTRQGKAFLNTSSVVPQRMGKNFEFRHIMKERIVGSVIDSYKKLLKAGYSYSDLGILTPTNIGEVGTLQINKAIQEVVNPQGINKKDEHTFGSKDNKRTIRVGDYVMNTENFYDAKVVNKAETADIFNGECGTVIAVNISNKEIIVDFDGSHILFSFSEAVKKLNHAWAITIHKSQGSQYEVVLAIVDGSSTYQMNANLLYTAMSRARKFLGVFGQAKTYNRALKKFANFDRNSFLGEFLDISFTLQDLNDAGIGIEEAIKHIQDIDKDSNST